MTVRKTNDFDRTEYLRNFISAFLQSETKGHNAVAGALNALDKQTGTSNVEIDNQRRKILDALFTNQKMLEIIQRKKRRKRNTTSG